MNNSIIQADLYGAMRMPSEIIGSHRKSKISGVAEENQLSKISSSALVLTSSALSKSQLDLGSSWVAVSPIAYDNKAVKAPTAAKQKAQQVAMTLVGAANTAAVGAHKLELGARLLYGATLYNTYSASIAGLGWLGTCRPVQYLAAQAAKAVAEKAVAYTVYGVSAGTLATVGAAVGTALTVAEVGAGIHNAFFANSEEEKISLNPLAIAKGAFKFMGGFGGVAEAATAPAIEI